MESKESMAAVVGGIRGNGRAVAIRFAAAGSRVIVRDAAASRATLTRFNEAVLGAQLRERPRALFDRIMRGAAHGTV